MKTKNAGLIMISLALMGRVGAQNLAQAESDWVDKGIVYSSGTSFEVVPADLGDAGLPIVVEVDAEIEMQVQASSAEVALFFGPDSSRVRTFTIKGLQPGTLYHLYKGNYHAHETFTSDSAGSHTLAVDTALGVLFIQLEPSTYFLVDDGVGGTGGDCASIGIWDGGSRTCTLTSDVQGTVQIDSPSLTLDCMSHSLTGPGSLVGSGIFPRAGVAHNAVVRHCEVSGYTRGFLGVSTSGHSVEDNHFHDNLAGLLFIQSTDHSVSGNEINFNNLGVLASFAHRSVFTSNRIENNDVGMGLFFSDHVGVHFNAFLRNRQDRALRLWDGTGNVVADNTFVENTFGITITFGGSHEIRDNAFLDNGFWESLPAGDSPAVAIAGELSNDNVFRNNVMVGNAYGFGLSGTGNDIDISNTVDGRFIYWFRNLTGETINPGVAPNAAGVYCESCDGVTIEDFVLDVPMGIGIGLYASENSTVRRNVVRDASWGIHLAVGSSRNLLSDNDISLGFEDVFAYGIRLNGADDNTISDNTIDLGPGNSGWSGVSLGLDFPADGGLIPSNGNIVVGNSITRVLQRALQVAGSNNVIEQNTTNDTGGGVLLFAPGVDTVENIIRENTFKNGRPAWFPFQPAPGTFGHGVDLVETRDTVVTRNLIKGMSDLGLKIVGSVGTLVSQNDISDNGGPFQVVSSDSSEENPEPMELSIGGIGNYWGRNCGQEGAQSAPLFQPGIDSNGAQVQDSHPFSHPVSDIPAGSPSLKPGSCSPSS